MRLTAAESFRAAGDRASADRATLDGIDPRGSTRANQFDLLQPARAAVRRCARLRRRQAGDRRWPFRLNADERNVLRFDRRRSGRSGAALRRRRDQSDELFIFDARRRRRTVHRHRGAHLGRRQSHPRVSNQRARRTDAEHERRGMVATRRCAAAQFRSRRRTHRHQRLAAHPSGPSCLALAADCASTGSKAACPRRLRSHCCCRCPGRWRTPGKPFATVSSPRSFMPHRR